MANFYPETIKKVFYAKKSSAFIIFPKKSVLLHCYFQTFLAQFRLSIVFSPKPKFYAYRTGKATGSN
jgi:hypothetical protein